MGKRKSRTSKLMAAPRKPQKLDKEFTCLFCGHPNAVECRIDLKDRYAVASCRICSEIYFTGANALTEPVDIYSEWIDACELANQGVRRCRPRPGDAAGGDYEDYV